MGLGALLALRSLFKRKCSEGLEQCSQSALQWSEQPASYRDWPLRSMSMEKDAADVAMV